MKNSKQNPAVLEKMRGNQSLSPMLKADPLINQVDESEKPKFYIERSIRRRVNIEFSDDI